MAPVIASAVNGDVVALPVVVGLVVRVEVVASAICRLRVEIVVDARTVGLVCGRCVRVASELVSLTRLLVGASPHLLSRLRVQLGIPTQLARVGLSAAGLRVGTTSVGFGLCGKLLLLQGDNAIVLRVRTQFFYVQPLLLETSRTAPARHEHGDDDGDDDDQYGHDDDDELILFHAANASPANAVPRMG